MMSRPASSYPIWFHGRRLGRRLSPAQRSCLEEGMAQFSVPQMGTVDLPLLFGRAYNKHMLEIGFGNGAHLIALAKAHPECGIIGCEPYINGLAAVCGKLRQNKIHNVRLCGDDVATLLPRLPQGALTRIYILFPDPWPKKRHHKRRLLTASFLQMLAPLLAEEGEVIIATDHPGYFEWIEEAVLAQTCLKWVNKECPRMLPQNWQDTKYAQKGREKGDPPFYIRLLR